MMLMFAQHRNVTRHASPRLQYDHEWGRYRPVAAGGAYTPGPRKCGEFYDPEPIQVEEWTFTNTWVCLPLDLTTTSSPPLHRVFPLDSTHVRVHACLSHTCLCFLSPSGPDAMHLGVFCYRASVSVMYFLR